MKSTDVKYFNLDPGLKLTFVLLVGLILGGNCLLIWQFHIGQRQTERVSRVSAQMVSVLRLQGNLLSFHQRLGELAQSKDASVLKTESEALRGALLEQLQKTRSALTSSPSGAEVDPLLLPTLDAVEIGLPAQLDAITALASSGDWNAVNFRIDERLKPVEIQTSALVKSVDQDFVGELSRSESNMKSVQDRILILVPATAISTFFIATFFAWAIARKIHELRFEERVSERTRIARELHDTLLQSFQGLILNFQRARNLLPTGPEQAMESLDTALDKAERAIMEGRDAIHDIRTFTRVDRDLVEEISALGEEIAATDGRSSLPNLRVVVEGSPRAVRPLVRNEILQIAREALRNAHAHAHARNIEAEIRYEEKMLRVRIRDDGIGINQEHMGATGRAGHYGLRGMRERAAQMRMQLDVWTEQGAGTEIELSIPDRVAYKAG